MDSALLPTPFLKSLSRILRVGGVTAALGSVGLWLTLGLTSGASDSGFLTGTDREAAVESFFLRADPTAIDGIRITYPGGSSHSLRKAAGVWEIQDGAGWFALNSDRAAGLFGAPGEGSELFLGITGSLQGSNPANHDRVFGVSGQSGIQASFYLGETEVEQFIVGRGVSGSSGWSTYVRRPESNGVYLLPGKLTDNFSGESVSTWRRRFLFPGLLPEDILKITVSPSHESDGYVLSRPADSPASWTVTNAQGSHPANPDVAQAMCEWIARLRTADFFDESGGPTPAGPVAELQLLVRGHSGPYGLKVMRQAANPVLVRVEVTSPNEATPTVLGVFDLFPLWRNSNELMAEAPDAVVPG